MRIVSAGMPGPLLLRGDKCRVLQIAGMPPGLFPEATYEEFSLQLQPGDSVFFCTHGLTDARNAMEEEFGVERIEEACVRHAGESAVDLLGHVFSGIGKFTAHCRQRDDMTAAVFHYPSRSANPAVWLLNGQQRDQIQLTPLGFSRKNRR